MRNLTKALVAVSLLTSTGVHSLGIGGIKLRSALNQKLNAEIALVTSGGENVGDIQVKLASPAKFDEAGVPWSYFLTKIKFTPITKADGSVGVKLTSDEALKEPYLDFLVEVTGPNGTLFREFTVLVDPPTSYKRPVVSYVPREPVQPPVRQAPVAQAQDELYPQNDGRYDSSVNEYGPTHRSDTIWSIANLVKPDDVTAAQMVMAIYEANPTAFSRPNVNTLLAGKMLDIPDHDAVLKISHPQALAEFKQQGHRWQGGDRASKASDYPSAAAGEHKQKHASSRPAKSTKHLKLNPPPEEVDVAQGDVVAHAANTAETNKHDGLAAGSAEDADLKQRFEKIEQQLQLMQKMLELKDAQLAILQKQASPAAANKDAELKLAEPLKAAPIAEAPAVPPVAVKPPTTVEPAPAPAPINLPIAAVAPEPVIAPAPVVAAPPVTPKPLVEVAPKPLVETALANPFADYYLLAGGIGASLLGALGLILWRKRKVEKTIDTESMFASASQISLPDADKDAAANINRSSGYEVGTVGDSSFLSDFTPSEFDAFETDQTEIDPLSEADVYLAYGRYQQAEELIRQVIAEYPNRNDCKLKLLEIFHTSENRPEFDQYVQQLTDEGKQADTTFWAKVVDMANEFPIGSGDTTATASLKANASRAGSEIKPALDEYDFDLSELSEPSAAPERAIKPEGYPAKPVVQATTASIFLDQAQDAAAVKFGGNSPVTPAPEFSGKNEPFDSEFNFDLNLDAPNVFSSSAVTEDIDDAEATRSLEFDLNAFAAENSDLEDESIEFIVEDDSPNGLDFDLNAFVTENSAADEENIEFMDENDGNSLEFNLNSFGDDFKPQATKGVASKGLSMQGGFDIDLEATQDQDALNLEGFDFSANDEQDESIRDLDFSTTGLNLKTTSIAENKPKNNEVEDFDFDFDFPVKGVAANSNKPIDDIVLGDLTNTENAVETKVNLANAYVDMGDIDAAKVIAHDLLKGSAEQKKAGQVILEKIS